MVMVLMVQAHSLIHRISQKPSQQMLMRRFQRLNQNLAEHQAILMVAETIFPFQITMILILVPVILRSIGGSTGLLVMRVGLQFQEMIPRVLIHRSSLATMEEVGIY